jgi:hypothetical protein
MLFIPLNFNLNKLKNVFDIIEVALLRPELILEVLDSFAILLVKILKCIDQVYILKSDQGFLEDAEVEHLNLINRMPRHFIRKCLKH